MAKFAVTVEGQKYAVEAPDENTAWAWANQTHRAAPKQSAADQIANDVITRGAKQNAAPIPSMVPLLESVAKSGGISPSPMGTMTGIAAQGVNDLMEKGSYEGGGRVTDMAATHMPAPVAGALGYGANVGMQMIPAVVGGMIGAREGAPIMRAGAERVMRSALKPSVAAVENGKAGRAINTLLDEGGGIFPGVNVTPGGAAYLQRGATNLGNQAQAILDNSPAMVNKVAATNPMNQAIQRIQDRVGRPNESRQAMESVQNEFLSNEPWDTHIPIARANRYKQSEYQRIGDAAYGELSTPNREAGKTLARGLRGEIETLEPSVGPINAQQGDLLNALNQVTRRNAVSGNKDPVSFGALATDPRAMAAFMAQRSELIKSLLARSMNAGREVIPGAAGAGIGAAYGQQGE